jgi:signal transduction histidine kinase
MRLAAFIRENTKPIIGEWENFARTLRSTGSDRGSLALRDHIEGILSFIANDIESAQTGQEQFEKSLGEKASASVCSAAETHAALRLAGGFDLNQMVSEYRALRASVIKLWGAKTTGHSPQDMLDLIRFNESIDQELVESISHYEKKVNHSKNLFLGILSHDLRTPISAALMSAKLMPKIGKLNERQAMLSSQIVDCMSRASDLITNLFDLARARFGSGLLVARDSMDMGFVGRQLAAEMRTVFPDSVVNLEVSGETRGQWDKARIGQVFSNLIGNAIHYGFKGVPVDVIVAGSPEEVMVLVHNMGTPIPPSKIGEIFNPLSRAHEGDDNGQAQPIHLGLGLYITREIVNAHGGTIQVTSSEKDGTTFTACFPRAENSST